MQHKHLQFGSGFRVMLGDAGSQAAQMTLEVGNSHQGADQWLFVVSGKGFAHVNQERIELREGTLLLIQKGEKHEICNTGTDPLRTLNIYVPPAYTANGDERPAGRAEK